MWRLSGFADEISPDLGQQIEVLGEEGIRWLDLRSVADTNVLDLSDVALETIKSRLDAQGIGVAAIASPVGKTPITDEFASQLDAFERALAIARHFQAEHVRIFSFYLPPDADPAAYRDEVLRRLASMTRLAEQAGITLVLENERSIYGDLPERCHDLLSSIGSPRLRAAWDPANYVHCGVRPFPEGFQLLRPFIAYLHVKDARLGMDGSVPAGAGDSEWPATIAALRDDGFAGTCALEPHLARGGRFGGFSGPEAFRAASRAFKALLQEQAVAWS